MQCIIKYVYLLIYFVYTLRPNTVLDSALIY